jgi:hypothetical protein
VPIAPAPSLRQAQYELLDLLAEAAPVLNDLLTARIPSDREGWPETLAPVERFVLVLCLSFAALSVGDLLNPPEKIPNVN